MPKADDWQCGKGKIIHVVIKSKTKALLSIDGCDVYSSHNLFIGHFAVIMHFIWLSNQNVLMIRAFYLMCEGKD